MATQSQAVYAFDVYGTLVDTQSLLKELCAHFGSDARAISELWRQKQLEYSFRRGLMGTYVPFSTITEQALNYATMSIAGVQLSAEHVNALLIRYRSLQAFDDVKMTLASINEEKSVRCFAFSNGDPGSVRVLLETAGISNFLEGVVSVENAESFKPDPTVYAHFNSETGSQANETTLISSNPFDVIGAMSFGWKTVWVNRGKGAVFDPWDLTPDRTISSLEELIHSQR